jgi:H+/Cl- antiporter ClcA
MKPKLIVAGILIVLGVVAFVYQGITYTTQSEGVNIGSLHLSTEQTHRIPLPPILGAIALVGGIALLLVDKRAPRPTTIP